jgi:hypothetical protein
MVRLISDNCGFPDSKDPQALKAEGLLNEKDVLQASVFARMSQTSCLAAALASAPMTTYADEAAGGDHLDSLIC